MIRLSKRFQEGENKTLMLTAESDLKGREDGKYCYSPKIGKWVRVPVSVAEYTAANNTPDNVPLWTPIMPVFPAN